MFYMFYLIVMNISDYTKYFSVIANRCVITEKDYWGRKRSLPIRALKLLFEDIIWKILFEDIICNNIVMFLKNFCEKTHRKRQKLSHFYNCLELENFADSITHVFNRYKFDHIQWNDKQDLYIWALAGPKFHLR